MDLPMTDIDFAPTANGGRLRLSSIVKADRPTRGNDGTWQVFVETNGETRHGSYIGTFSSQSAANQWLDANLPMRELP